MTKKKRNCIVGGVLTVALFISAFIMMLGILDAVTEINDTLIREDAESILAEAGIKNEDKVSLSVAYYDENNKWEKLKDRFKGGYIKIKAICC